MGTRMMMKLNRRTYILPLGYFLQTVITILRLWMFIKFFIQSFLSTLSKPCCVSFPISGFIIFCVCVSIMLFSAHGLSDYFLLEQGIFSQFRNKNILHLFPKKLNPDAS